jgi:hypothetical protein
MSAPTVTIAADSVAPNQDTLDEPPSLQRRAPARIDIARKAGKPLSMRRQKIYLRAGRSFAIQVLPPTAAARVEIAAEPPLQTIVPASRVESGSVPSYHAEFSGQLPPQIIPIPKTGKVHVTIIDGKPDPCRVTIPVTVWPSYSVYAVWWLLAFLSIVGLRWRRIVADSDSFPEILQALGNDFPHLLGLLGLSSIIVIPLRFIGWLVSLTETD